MKGWIFHVVALVLVLRRTTRRLDTTQILNDLKLSDFLTLKLLVISGTFRVEMTSFRVKISEIISNP